MLFILSICIRWALPFLPFALGLLGRSSALRFLFLFKQLWQHLLKGIDRFLLSSNHIKLFPLDSGLLFELPGHFIKSSRHVSKGGYLRTRIWRLGFNDGGVLIIHLNSPSQQTTVDWGNCSRAGGSKCVGRPLKVRQEYPLNLEIDQHSTLLNWHSVASLWTYLVWNSTPGCLQSPLGTRRRRTISSSRIVIFWLSLKPMSIDWKLKAWSSENHNENQRALLRWVICSDIEEWFDEHSSSLSGSPLGLLWGHLRN